MSLNVNFKKPVGRIIQKNGFKATVYESNAMFAACYKQGDEMVLYTFFLDEEHLRNCLGLTKAYRERGAGWMETIRRVELRGDFPGCLKMAKAFAEAGIEFRILPAKNGGK